MPCNQSKSKYFKYQSCWRLGSVGLDWRYRKRDKIKMVACFLVCLFAYSLQSKSKYDMGEWVWIAGSGSATRSPNCNSHPLQVIRVPSKLRVDWEIESNSANYHETLFTSVSLDWCWGNSKHGHTSNEQMRQYPASSLPNKKISGQLANQEKKSSQCLTVVLISKTSTKNGHFASNYGSNIK